MSSHAGKVVKPGTRKSSIKGDFRDSSQGARIRELIVAKREDDESSELSFPSDEDIKFDEPPPPAPKKSAPMSDKVSDASLTIYR